MYCSQARGSPGGCTWEVVATLVAVVLACRPIPTRDERPDTASTQPEQPGTAHVAEGASSGTEAARESGSPEDALRELLASMGVRYLAGEGIEVAGWVNMQSGLVEVFACAPEGKTHEAVVVLDCVPSGLHAALLALGLEPRTPVESGTEAEYRPPSGDRVEIQVRWTGADGEAQEAPAEDWIWDEKRGCPMERTSWIFTGSFLQTTPGTDGASTYAANYVKSLITTYHDATSVIENPWPDGIDDTVYYSNHRAVPPVGTPITIVFRKALE